ncbi:MAG TPA: hypothetical protein VGD98_26625 [Ktedonobacteraceae bacterium]
MDPELQKQLAIYSPWFFIAAVFGLFALLRLTRTGLRRRVDRIGYHIFRERGLLIWFWINAPGVVLHELSHALVVLLFYPFGFRISSITFFRIKPKVIEPTGGRLMRAGGRTSLQLGEVQYLRPQGKIMSRVGDGLSAVAPLFGGLLAFYFLYWVCTGNTLWEALNNVDHLQIFHHPGWPWWTLAFGPYLILTVTSELWPSRQDWRGARWLLVFLLLLGIFVGIGCWFGGLLVFNHTLLLGVSSASNAINFVLLVLLALDLAFLLIAEVFARVLGC